MKRCTFAVLSFVWLLCSCGAKPVVQYEAVVEAEYPHDSQAYTQGLFFHNDSLYETTGCNGRSSLRKVDLQSGKVLQMKKFAAKYFGEGSCIVGDNLYVLTWQNGAAFVYDARTLEYRKTLQYPREGWGLIALPEPEGKAVMVASDGSSNLYWLDEDLGKVKVVKVTMDGKPVRLLNELEWIDGKIWANVYTTDIIVIINPSNGFVEGVVDCSNLFPYKKRTPEMDVFNGIAQSPDGSIYVTGKNWPKLFKISLKETNKK